MDAEPTVLLGVKLPASLRRELDTVAKEEDRSLSAVTRLALRRYIKAAAEEESVAVEGRPPGESPAPTQPRAGPSPDAEPSPRAA